MLLTTLIIIVHYIRINEIPSGLYFAAIHYYSELSSAMLTRI